MSARCHLTPEGWAILRWLAQRTWATRAQIIDRFFCYGGAPARTGYALVRRMESQRLIQVHRLDPLSGPKSISVVGVRGRGFTAIGQVGRAPSYRPGPALDLMLQLTEMHTERAAEGWCVIPSGDKHAQLHALRRAQVSAGGHDPAIKALVGNLHWQSARNSDGLPMLDLIVHPLSEAARYVIPLPSRAAVRRALPWNPSVWPTLRALQPLTIELVCLDPSFEKTLHRWIKNKLYQSEIPYRIHAVRSFRARRSPLTTGAKKADRVDRYVAAGVQHPVLV
jgi:hypothetical protein